MNLSETTTVCFVASYAVALSMELVGLVRRVGWRRMVMLGFAFAGVFAHVVFLVNQTRDSTAPLASPAEWSSVAALTLACIYLFSSFTTPRQAIGLFLLPLVLLLLGVSALASDEPFATQRASIFWGRVHGWLLMLATVTVIVGFLAGVMYLIQSWRLKHKLPPDSRFRLPSLEALETTNARSLAVSVALVAGGFASGLVLAGLRQSQGQGQLWRDPLVISLTVMLVWLVAAELFRLLYPSARRGRKVAYLTVASFGFLMIVLASMLVSGGAHGAGDAAESAPVVGSTAALPPSPFRPQPSP
ncbi:MAG: cytochrome c biogenesis protein CcsA [Planctomycetales bacterium]|nr:cytochrome c biogenesis protein CcsA [Planctomycetales bacterium]